MSTLLVEPNSPCPCQSAKAPHACYAECCRPYLEGSAEAETAEKLMRSRYTAYALGNLDYIKRSWHPDTLPPDLRLVPGQSWVRLAIKRTEDGRENHNTGVVEFVAISKRNGRARRMHEVSTFEKLGGRWVYVCGDYSST